MLIVIFVRREEDVEMIISEEKLMYAHMLNFEFQFMYEGVRRNTSFVMARAVTMPSSPYYNSSITELAFVSDEEYAANFQDNVIVGWPRDNLYEGIIIGIHLSLGEDGATCPRTGALLREPFYLEDFGLSYPLTRNDLADNWEKVSAFLNKNFGMWMHEEIMADALFRSLGIMDYGWPKRRYKEVMRFMFARVVDGDITPTLRDDVFDYPLVFVHNEEEATRFTGEAVVAWPANVPWLESRVTAINEIVVRTESDLLRNGRLIREVISLEDYGLSYPITLADFVDQWESVARLWDALSYYEYREIDRASARYLPTQRDIADAIWGLDIRDE